LDRERTKEELKEAFGLLASLLEEEANRAGEGPEGEARFKRLDSLVWAAFSCWQETDSPLLESEGAKSEEATKAALSVLNKARSEETEGKAL